MVKTREFKNGKWWNCYPTFDGRVCIPADATPKQKKAIALKEANRVLQKIQGGERRHAALILLRDEKSIEKIANEFWNRDAYRNEDWKDLNDAGVNSYKREARALLRQITELK